MDKEILGAFITEERKALGLTQRELAEKLQVTDKAVSKWERGLSYPDVTLLEPLAAALGMGVEELAACRRMERQEREEDSVKNLLEISRDSVKTEKRRGWSRLLGVLMLLLATGLVIWYSAVIVTEQRRDRIFLKETVDGKNYLYVELKNEGHLLKLKCGPEVDFDRIDRTDARGGELVYLIDCRWNRNTYTGTVNSCEPTGEHALGGLEDAVVDASDSNQVFGLYGVLYAPENYYRNPYAEGFLCDYRFWVYEGIIQEGLPTVVEDGVVHYATGADPEHPLLLVEDCVSAAVYDWDGDGDNEVIVRTRWPEKPYTVYDMVEGAITEAWPDTVPEEVRELLVCVWEQ